MQEGNVATLALDKMRIFLLLKNPQPLNPKLCIPYILYVCNPCRHAFSVRFPMGPALRKELGEQLMAAGLVGAAMTLFEELELWDALILCYRLLQKNVQAEELVNRRLEVSCTLCHNSSESSIAASLCAGPGVDTCVQFVLDMPS